MGGTSIIQPGKWVPLNFFSPDYGFHFIFGPPGLWVFKFLSRSWGQLVQLPTPLDRYLIDLPVFLVGIWDTAYFRSGLRDTAYFLGGMRETAYFLGEMRDTAYFLGEMRDAGYPSGGPIN